jgi:hypothetical protein
MASIPAFLKILKAILHPYENEDITNHNNSEKLMSWEKDVNKQELWNANWVH